MRLSTLCFLVKEDEILLAMKKRGFGAGKWNGVGGKVEEGESAETAALRELHEEIGVEAREEHLEEVAVLRFRSENAELEWDVNVYVLRQWKGVPFETEEMEPRWYKAAELPFGEMWPDDKHWLPHVLEGRKIEGVFRLDPSGKDIVDFTIAEIR